MTVKELVEELNRLPASVAQLPVVFRVRSSRPGGYGNNYEVDARLDQRGIRDEGHQVVLGEHVDYGP